MNAILLQNLTGGQVEVGTAGGADGSGGTLSATGAAIVITNAANVHCMTLTLRTPRRGRDRHHEEQCGRFNCHPGQRRRDQRGERCWNYSIGVGSSQVR